MDDWRRMQARHEQRVHWRRMFAQDAGVFLLVLVLLVGAGLMLYRMDIRSEQLLSVVATERACVCPRP